MSQKGGLIINDSGGGHVSFSMAADTAARSTSRPECARPQEGMRLEAPEIATMDEFRDGVGLQILAVFPNFVLQQIRDSSPCARHPAGLDKCELVCNAFGSPMTRLR